MENQRQILAVAPRAGFEPPTNRLTEGFELKNTKFHWQFGPSMDPALVGRDQEGNSRLIEYLEKSGRGGGI